MIPTTEPITRQVASQGSSHSPIAPQGSDLLRRLALWTVMLGWVRILHVQAADAPRWTSEAGWKWLATQPAKSTKPGFQRVSASRSGVSFTNRLSALFAMNNQILENGAGLALGDMDGDGWVDLYFCGSENPNALYRNRGDGSFEEVTSSAGVACPGQFSTGALLADVDGDNDLDLLVNGLGTGTRLFINDGSGRFGEAIHSGLNRTAAATSMAMADVDGDGDLDLYVTCYRTTTARGDPELPKISARVIQSRVEVTPSDRFFGVLRANGQVEVVEKGEPDTLYLNLGNGTFQPVSWTGGAFLDTDGKPLATAPEDWGLSVLMRDLNGDGHIDIYVCNDFFRSRDRFWIGDGRGHFRAIGHRAWRSMPLSSMSIDAGDLNRDGIDDFLAVEMLSRNHAERQRQRANALKVEHDLPWSDPDYVPEVLANTVQLGRGDGTFADVSWLTGLAATDWSWNVALLDVDLDGWEDVLIATGNNHDVLDMDAQNELDRSGPNSTRPGLDFYPSLPQRNLIYRNLGALSFRETGVDWGWEETGISQAMGLADLDNDGDLDVVIGRLNQECLIYLNQASAPRIAVELRGRSRNTEGVGARVRVFGPDFTQQQQIVAGGRYLSADQKRRSFALPGSSGSYRLEIEWPSHAFQVISNLAPNRIYQVEEPSSAATQRPPRPVSQPWFTEMSVTSAVRHVDALWDELAAQPLLPELLGRRGPGLSWLDVDGDEDEDLVIGSGSGGRTVVLTNQSSAISARFQPGFLTQVISNDQHMILKAGSQLLISSQNEPGSPASVREGVIAKDLNPTLADPAIDQLIWSAAGGAAALTVGDYDQDGDLDLWVGGVSRSGRFPESSGSAYLVRTPAGWTRKEPADQDLSGLNRIAGLVSTDLDGDGDLDVVAVSEWGGIHLLRNTRGHFATWPSRVDVTQLSPPVKDVDTVDQLTGFWRGVGSGDFDGDGRMDLVISNQGWNQPSSLLLPWYLYFGDLAGSGAVDLIEAFDEPVQTARRVPWRAWDVLTPSLPSLKERFPTYRQFARATVEEVLGEASTRAGFLVVRTSTSLVLLNRGDHFEARPLPMEAQISVATGLVVADFDGDGSEDLFIAQNWFAFPPETPRAAGGRGLLLRGDGRGAFSSVSGNSSGIRIDGEQRAAATADFDQDGRTDLAVSQNRGPMILLKNQIAKPGLAVKLRGAQGNPECYGASMRMKFGNRLGPRRELHGGSGYLSCDGTLTVLAIPETATSLEVRWPDGVVTEHPVAKTSERLVIRQSTRLKP